VACNRCGEVSIDATMVCLEYEQHLIELASEREKTREWYKQRQRKYWNGDDPDA